MAAQLRQTQPAPPASDGGFRAAPHWFTVVEARRALPYVARVARDAAAAYQRVQLCRTSLARALAETERRLMAERRDAAINRLNAAIDECDAVGVDLIDIGAGFVRFAALAEGRPISLLWRLGESVVRPWPEIDSDAADALPLAHAATR